MGVNSLQCEALQTIVLHYVFLLIKLFPTRFSKLFNSNTVRRTQTQNTSKRASRSDSVCFYTVLPNKIFSRRSREKTAINFPSK